MVIPLYDNSPFSFRSPPYVSWFLLSANVLLFVLFQTDAASEAVKQAMISFALTPASFFHTGTAVGSLVVPWPLTLFSYMFLHGGWLHLIGNMLFLWVFGDDIENALGHFRFLLFYLMSGIAAGFAHYLSNTASLTPLIGSSGAIAGVIAAYLILRPCNKVWVLVLGRIPIKIAAYWALGFWVVIQVVNVMAKSDDDVSWWAHIGGLIVGAGLVVVMRQPGVKLFDCTPDPVKPSRSDTKSSADAR
jgi:membrane associated rhomboid family serine protease